MSTGVQRVLESFDALSDDEKREAAVAILRRTAVPPEGDIPEAALVEAADELFRKLDAAEAGHGQS